VLPFVDSVLPRRGTCVRHDDPLLPKYSLSLTNIFTNNYIGNVSTAVTALGAR
jgi:hypothetical protein